MVADYLNGLYRITVTKWNRFWFAPSDPTTLAVIRIAAGAMLFYTHLVWSLDLPGFLGPSGRLELEFVEGFYKSRFAWSHFYFFSSTTALWIIHLGALLVFALLTVGLWTRVVSVLAFLFTVSYAHRAAGALFGLDQINVLLALYLAIGPAGAVLSMDQWRRQRAGRHHRPQKKTRKKKDRSATAARTSTPGTYVSATVAIRLIQVHMCIVYLFAGLGKLQGESWWSGTAMWLALANYEYQTLDMTWFGQWPYVINAMSLTVIVWEISYSALIWPRWTRPLMLALAVPLHLGIAVCMGMITFGLVMLIGNVAFVPPDVMRRVLLRQQGRAGEAAA